MHGVQEVMDTTPASPIFLLAEGKSRFTQKDRLSIGTNDRQALPAASPAAEDCRKQTDEHQHRHGQTPIAPVRIELRSHPLII